MSYLTLSIIIPILLLSSGAVLHIHNLNQTYRKMVQLVGPGVTKDVLYKEMTVAHGSNFTAMATSSWIMTIVAISYLYFFFPGTFPYNYMMLAPELASSKIGFFIFGTVIALLAAFTIWILDMLPNNFRNYKPSELYSFYSISKELKIYIIIPIILLSVSIISSAFSGTIYPARNSIAELISFILICLSIGILIFPIWRGRE